MIDFVEGDEPSIEFDPVAAAAIERKKLETIERDEDLIVQHLQRTKSAYAAVFKGGASEDDLQFVLHDLAWFCKAYESVFDPTNPRMQEHLIGRQAVFMRIKEFSELDTDTLIRRYHNKQS